MIKKKYLFVSFGSISERHIINLKKLYPNSLIGVLRLSNIYIKKKINVDFIFHNLDEALSFKPSAVFVCSPANTHIKIASIFAKKNIPIFIEKPLSTNLVGLNFFLERIQKNKIPLMVGYNLKFMESFIKLKHFIDKQKVGNILSVISEVGQYLPYWRPEKDYSKTVSAQNKLGGGAILELSHEIDYICYLFGIPNFIFASGGKVSNLKIDVEDIVDLSLIYDSPKKIINIHMDFLQRDYIRKCKIIGSKGTLIWDLSSGSIDLSTQKKRKNIFKLRNKNQDIRQSYLSEIKYFIKNLNKFDSLRINHDKNVLKVLVAAKKSLKSRKLIKIN